MTGFLLKKFEEKSVYRIIFCIIAFFSILYLLESCRYSIPLGDDGIVCIWPAGKIMTKSSLKDFFTTLISSFKAEDHLAPLQYFFGYLFALYSSDPSLIFNISAKLSYLFMLIICLIAVFDLWKDSIRLLIFFLFFTFNLLMTWRHMMIIIMNLPIILSLLSLFFLNRFIKNKKYFDLSIFIFVFFLSTLSAELAFVEVPLLGVYALLSIWNSKATRKEKIRDILRIYLLMFFSLLPYMIIHNKVHGTIFPASRIEEAEGNHLIYYYKILIEMILQWSFGIGGVLACGKAPLIKTILITMFFIFSGFSIYSVYRFKLLSRTGVYLFIGFLSQVIFILYTGRNFEPGLWTFAGIIFNIVIVDIIYHIFIKFSKGKETASKIIYLFILSVIPLFVLINAIVNPFKFAESRYQRPYESTQAAYKAINEAADRIVIIRLPDAEELFDPAAFWLGNKIYHGEPGFRLYPDYHQLLHKNMNIQVCNDVNNRPFAYFRPFLLPIPGNKEIIVFKDKNLFYRIFLDANDYKILRAAVIPYAASDYFNLNFPDLSKYNIKSSAIEFVLTFLSNPHDIDKIIYGGKQIDNWEVLDNKILFLNPDLSFENSLIIKSRSNQTRLELIEVNFPKNNSVILKGSGNARQAAISLVTSNMPCRFRISSPNEDIRAYGTLDTQKSTYFNIWGKGPFELVTRNFELKYKKQKICKIDDIETVKKNSTVHICSSQDRCP